MLSEFAKIIRAKISLAKYSLLPSIIFGVALISFYFKQEYTENTLITAHIFFYILAAISLGMLLHVNQSYPAFFIITIVLSYFFINFIKKYNSADFSSSVAYANLGIIIPLNLIFFYFSSNKPLLTRTNIYIILAVFFQISVLETLGKMNVSLDIRHLGYDFLSLKIILFAAMNLCFLLKSSIDGEINSAAMFFSALCVSFGFYYSYNPSALTTFFASAMLILTLSIAKNIYYTTYKDLVTGFYSRYSYILQSKKLPLKYSTGIISVDNYDKILTVFGKSKTANIIKMISMKIKELEPEAPVYRYNDDEFIIIFKNESKEHGFEHLENIRKSIASSEFVVGHKSKALKLTISCSITEKKRSDATALEVFKRAKKALQNTNQFAQNFTSRA